MEYLAAEEPALTPTKAELQTKGILFVTCAKIIYGSCNYLPLPPQLLLLMRIAVVPV